MSKFVFNISMISVGCALMGATPVMATPPNSGDTLTSGLQGERVGLDSVQNGSLLLKTGVPGQFIKAPMVKTDVDIDVTGPIVRATVSQVFTNNSHSWVEGTYVFPLPEGAAVDHLKMVVGDRLIEGQIEERQKAKAIYEKAKAEGKKASLLTQERPNIFTNSVANIGPGESVAIQIEYQDIAKMEDGVFSLRFPMTVAPRFSPPREQIRLASADGAQSIAILDPVLDRDRISPPLLPPDQEPMEYIRLPVSIDIDLQAGFALENVTSPYHAIQKQSGEDGGLEIVLKDGAVPANRDFVLEWSAQPSNQPYASVFTQNVRGETFLMAMLTPAQPETPTNEQRIKRETVFVIDTSGSMGGQSIEQARKALLLALDRLQAGDRFNIIRYNNSHASLFKKPKVANAANLNLAKAYVGRLSAGGGTMMAPALEAALTMTGGSEEFLSQVIFITDGAIGNEKELFAILKRDLGATRLFPVGIGSAPNSYFMSRAAKFGHGKSTHIGNIAEVNARMSALLSDIESPVLRNLSVKLPGKSETFPAEMPDLYDGEPVVMVTKLDGNSLPDSLTVSGELADQNWQERFANRTVSSGNGLDVLWARRKIRNLEDQRFDRSLAASLDQKILNTALKYHLVSRLTSLVAVDVTPSRPAGARVNAANVPTMLPEGWDFAALSGNQAIGAPRQTQTQTPPPAPRPVPTPPVTQPLNMPPTASPHTLLVLLGTLFMFMAMVLRFGFGRKSFK